MSVSACEAILRGVNFVVFPIALAQVVPGCDEGRIQLDGFRQQRLRLRVVGGRNAECAALQRAELSFVGDRLCRGERT